MDLSILTQDVIKLTKEVGKFIGHEALTFDAKRIEYKGTNDMVSYVDKSAEKMLVSALSEFLPEAGFITEEKTIHKTGEAYNWIIDPLDGTTNFIHGIPTYSVSVGLEYNKELILGVVYEINRDECFSAWQNGGAYLNGNPIKVSSAKKLSETLIATGFPYYDFGKQAMYMEAFRDLMQKCHGLRRIGSAAVDLVYVACGRFDGYFEYNLNYYDVAAGIVIVKEAGGEVFDFSGGTGYINLRELIATNRHISNELLSSIKKHFETS
jgi:myo-inositol-1(or 4)-monophosphatase